MNDYVGKICPFCKTEFTPYDEIVVCSDCDMPHHKDCWIENQGCTTFGCLGTIKSADNSATSVTASQMSYEDVRSSATSSVVYCTKCGTQCSSTASFCSSCGNRLTTGFIQERTAPVYTQANPVNTNPHSYVNQSTNYASAGYGNYQPYQSAAIDGEVLRLIGKKEEYYIRKFKKIKEQNKQASWNWSAFLFPPYWFIYRKMYGYGAILLGANLIFAMSESTFLSLLSWGVSIALGIFANNIYLKFLENKATQAKSMVEPYKSQYIAQNSGVNKRASILSYIGFVVLIAIFSM